MMMSSKIVRLIRPGLVSALGFCLIGGLFAYAQKADVLPSPSPSVIAPGIEATVSPSPSPEAKLTSRESRGLFRNFKKAQSNELKALRHRQREEMKQLRASQKARLKEWQEREKGERRKFFEANTKGPERREYVAAMRSRRDALLNLQKDERKQREQEYDARFKAAQEDQRNKRKEFEEYLRKGERPSNELWPQNQY